MDFSKLKTSKDMLKMFNLTTGMITHYARMLNVQKFGNSYYWTEEQIEQVRQRVGQQGHAIDNNYSRCNFRHCNKCTFLQQRENIRICNLSGHEIRKAVKTSPIDCPLGQRLKK